MKIKTCLKKIVTSPYFLFLLAFSISFVDIYSRDILFQSGDAHETVKVIETFFSKNPYGSYVMYKGIYAFIPGVISLCFSKVTNLSIYFLWKIMKALAFAYLTVFGVPFLIEKVFKHKIEIWQKYLFILVTFLLERSSVYLVSVDLTSTLVLVLIMVETLKVLDKKNYFRLFFLGLLVGIGACLSGQYTISTYIMMLYLIISMIIKYHKQVKTVLVICFVFFLGFAFTKSWNTYYEKNTVNHLRENGAWIPTGHDWLIHGLSGGMVYINFPASLSDNVSQTFVKYNNESDYEIIMDNRDTYSPSDYVKMMIKHPVVFIVRWTDRLFLGLVNDPLNTVGIAFHLPLLVLIFMSICLYVCWKFIKENVKKWKDLISMPAILFYSVLFSALVPSFRHVENRYYLTARMALIAILLLSPLLSNFIKKLRKKKIQLANINMDFVTCLVFVIICIVAYFALYQSSNSIIQMF